MDFVQEPGFVLILLLALIFVPLITYLWRGLGARRRRVLAAIKGAQFNDYLKQHRPGVPPRVKSWEDLYDTLFGRCDFVIPVLLLLISLVIVWLFVVLAEAFVSRLVAAEAAEGAMSVALAAALGAYMWALFRINGLSLQRALAPRDLVWTAFRFAIAVPMAFALTAALKNSLAAPTAFLLGAFPTRTLLTFARRLATTQLSFTDQAGKPGSELQRLESLDREVAERLADLNVHNNVQLAYADPIRLAIRANLGFSATVDYISQALLWIYLEENLVKVRKFGLRGAQEAYALWKELHLEDWEDEYADLSSRKRSEKLKQLSKNADKTLEFIAKELDMSKDAFTNTLGQVAEDPYTKFLVQIWS